MKTISLLCALALLGLFAGTAEAAEAIGHVIAIDGSAKAVDDDGQERELDLKSDIFLNDTIRTGPETRIQIMFEDDTLFAQGADSEIEITEYVYDPDEEKNNSLLIRMGKGLFRIISGKIAELNPERFNVKTSRATIGIRGCELGFALDEQLDRIMMFRIPARKVIVVTADHSGDSTRVRNQGIQVLIDDAGRLWQEPLLLDNIRSILNGTAPLRGFARRRHAPGTRGRDGGAGQAPGMRRLVTLRPPLVNDRDTPSLPDPSREFDLSLQGPLNDGTQPSRLPASSLPSPGDNTSPDGGLLFRLSGGGAGSIYSGSTPQIIDQTFLYKQIEGAFGENSFDGQMYGQVFDQDGNLVGTAAIDLNGLSLADFGSATEYEGFIDTTQPDGSMLSIDNLQEFAVRQDPGDITQTLSYWGIEARSFPGSALPAGSVIEYDVQVLEQPPMWDGPGSPHDVETRTMIINTETRTFMVSEGTYHPAIIGSTEMLTLYGRESQGVGSVMALDPEFGSTPHFHSGVMAGYQVDGSEAPSDDGSWSHRGYAMARGWPDAASSTPIQHFRSTDNSTDLALENEGRVRVDVDRDAPGNNVDMTLTVFRDPSSPEVSDVRLNNPEWSGYAINDNYGAFFNDPSSQSDVIGRPGGTDWGWGEWHTEREVDYGGGPEPEHVEGEYVAGDTLSATDFQDLVDGSTAYTLSTVPGSDYASAFVGDGTFEVDLEGTADLTITIPGGGSQATWAGSFDLANGPDSLLIEVNSDISGNGHLSLSGPPTVYQLSANGTSYAAGDLSDYSMSGNLVGPGSGSTPITGAIGDGTFKHPDGMTVDLLYGTDLQ